MYATHLQSSHDTPTMLHRPGNHTRLQPWRFLVVLACGLYVLPICLITLTPLRWNLSASMPVGLYWQTRQPLSRGQIIGVCLPSAISQFGWERGYISSQRLALLSGECASGDQPVLKTLMAVGGDTVELQPDAVTINGTRIPQSATQLADSAGRILPHSAWGTYTLGADQIWLMSTVRPNSWDSRYFGPLHRYDVLTTVQPLWTWNNKH